MTTELHRSATTHLLLLSWGGLLPQCASPTVEYQGLDCVILQTRCEQKQSLVLSLQLRLFPLLYSCAILMNRGTVKTGTFLVCALSRRFRSSVSSTTLRRIVIGWLAVRTRTIKQGVLFILSFKDTVQPCHPTSVSADISHTCSQSIHKVLLTVVQTAGQNDIIIITLMYMKGKQGKQ